MFKKAIKTLSNKKASVLFVNRKKNISPEVFPCISRAEQGNTDCCIWKPPPDLVAFNCLTIYFIFFLVTVLLFRVGCTRAEPENLEWRNLFCSDTSLKLESWESRQNSLYCSPSRLCITVDLVPVAWLKPCMNWPTAGYLQWRWHTICERRGTGLEEAVTCLFLKGLSQLF